ncbi:hypothetical protein Pst134EA_004592 [Puccinia striiformis f. sp. tritici]|uniref:hypothetical protein n=1 Tax=Puccinia striiformis f. sp. tritici TaxID=168172 RepID=UPI0020074E2C|nr:hypothetical protein Pst134EA_004592 [Puccinia striiformis f. sp. tritici]KAH9470665.1 hypothetical protein Pst134EA_004592 [Puccinia striiformis f. sp. tritici]
MPLPNWRIRSCYIIYAIVASIALSPYAKAGSRQQCGIHFDVTGDTALCQSYAGKWFQCGKTSCHTGGRYTDPKTHPYTGLTFTKCWRYLPDGKPSEHIYTIKPDYYQAQNLKGTLDASVPNKGISYTCEWKHSYDINNARLWCNDCNPQ